MTGKRNMRGQHLRFYESMARSTRMGFLMLLAAIVLPLAVAAQTTYTIAQIQGAQATSPHVNKQVRVTGIVTAKLKSSFYIQTPDADVDDDPNTSEGLLIYGANSAGMVSLGDLVQVDGTVIEFRPKNEKIFLSITEITRPTVKILSKDNPLPAPIVLTEADLDPRGKLDQMEKFEGMRVRADVVVVAPTGGYPPNAKTGISTSNGVFFAALVNTPRPFREPGLDILTILLNKLPRTTPAFDMNPEMLRVNSQVQVGAKTLNVPAGATIKGLTGIVDYSRKYYTLLVDADPEPVVENIRGFIPLSPAGEREVTVGTFNIQNLFDDEVNSKNLKKEIVVSKVAFQNRLKKLSLAMRDVLSLPDILGVVEIENLQTLQKVADRINADVVAAGKPDPKYTAYLEDGNDFRGIDVGFLIKSSKIKVLESTPLAKDVKLDLPGVASDAKLYDRPPYLVRAEVIDPRSAKPLALTVIVSHFKSYLGIDSEKDGDNVRNKRRMQAEWLAKYVEDRQKADANENLILCGDFNAYQFNDGYNDLIGILKGKSDQTVLVPSKTAYNTGLVNLIDYIDQRNRYSYIYDGNAQALDHVLINRPLRSRLLKFGYARVAADFPYVYGNDTDRAERVTDHDAPVVFLSLDEPPAKSPQP